MAIGKEYHCKRCGFEWISRIEGTPVACPRCKSYGWRVKKRETFRWDEEKKK